MRTRWIWVVLSGSALLVAVVPGVAAQLSNLTATGHTGLAMPFGQFSEYTKAGPSAGIQIAYPIREPLAIVIDAGVDNPQSDAPYLPDFRLWRYQAGVEANLLGNTTEGWGVRGLLGVGATTFRANNYLTNQGPGRLDETYLTGSGGLALVFGTTSPLHGYLGARLNWTRVDADDFAALGTVTPGAGLDPVDDVLTVPITLGLRLRV